MRVAVPAILFALATPLSAGSINPCPADIDADGQVEIDDLLAVIEYWGDSGITRIVHVTNFEFQPDLLKARAGDTVQWVLDVGIHTVTSGDLCNGDGLFNAPLSVLNPTFSYTLDSDDAGTLNYFCDPHCGPGMSGSIVVAPFHADATGDGVVDIQDLLMIINAWGACP